MVKSSSTVTYLLLLCILLLLKLGLQIYYFVGLGIDDYLEEYLYLGWAQLGLRDNWSYLAHAGDWSHISDWNKVDLDPGYTFIFRVSAVYPTIILVSLFGASEWAVCLWCLICGLGSVICVAEIGRHLAGPFAGLLSALILSLVPAHILYTSRLNSDIPQLFFLSLAVLCVTKCLTNQRRAKIWALGAGLSCGLVYLAKFPVGLLAAVYAVLCPLFQARGGRKRLVLSGLILGGFLAVFFWEQITYYYYSGHWWLHWRILRGIEKNAINDLAQRKIVSIGFFDFGVYEPFWTHSFTQLLNALGIDQGLPVYIQTYFGDYTAIAICLLPLFIWFSRKNSARLIIIGGYFLYYLHLDPFYIMPTVHPGKLTLLMAFKNSRYYLPCLIGVSLVIGITLGELIARTPPKRKNFVMLCSLMLVGLAFIRSVPALNERWAIHRGSLVDYRQAANYIENFAPDGTRIFIPPFTSNIYQTLLYPTLQAGRQIELHEVAGPNDALCNGWFTVGGSEGPGKVVPAKQYWLIDSLQDYWREEALPPTDWKVLVTMPHSGLPGRSHLRIVELPPCKPLEGTA